MVTIYYFVSHNEMMPDIAEYEYLKDGNLLEQKSFILKQFLNAFRFFYEFMIVFVE